MSLEATMMLLDNSDWARNGDYIPTRWEAQIDSINLVANAKFQSHPENGVGVITMAGKQVEVLLTPTNENEKLLAVLYGIKLSGRISLKNSISIAQLALKHRLNKNQRQRILVFIASPVSEDEKTLINLAKKLKKNSVAVDIINIGEMDEGHISKLEKFIQNVNSSDNSHLLIIQPGIQLLADQIIGTSIMGGPQGGGNQGGGDNVGVLPQQFDGIDPNMDPELAMAIRISLEEEKERNKQIQEQKEKEKPQDPNDVKIDEEKVDPLKPQPEAQQPENEEELEDELIKRAKEMSLQDDENQKEDKKQDNIQDKEFLSDLLGLIPDLDKSNPDLFKTIQELGLDKEKDEKKGEKDKDQKDK